MIFSGGLVQYDNFNQKFVKDSGMPLFANLMPIRWADEACITEAYLINPVEQEIFETKVSLYEAAEKLESTTNQALASQFRKQKNDAQREIDSKLARIEHSDSIYRRYGNMYISKIVTTLKSSNIPPIYDTETSGEAKFLCGRKILAGKIISTYDYNVMALIIMNLILCIALVFLAKGKI